MNNNQRVDLASVDSCPYCRGARSPWHSISSGFLLCSDCGLVMREPMPSHDAIDQMYREYFSSGNIELKQTEMDSSETSIRNQATYFIARFVKPGMKVLDFGAGTGQLANSLQMEGYDIQGVEFSENARQAAQSQFGLELFPDLTKVKNYEYDLIISMEVVEHLVKPWEQLRLLYALLKPGGKIYISTPNRNGLLARLKKEKWREAVKPFHLMLFDFSALRRLMRDSGFENIRYMRFPPMTTGSYTKKALHRSLQLLGLYGGLHLTANKQ